MGAVRGDQVQVEVSAVAVPGQQHAQFGWGCSAAGIEELGSVALLAVGAADFDAVATVGE
ncbi:hypothetical protein D9M73_248200 [compost metagenome]